MTLNDRLLSTYIYVRTTFTVGVIAKFWLLLFVAGALADALSAIVRLGGILVR